MGMVTTIKSNNIIDCRNWFRPSLLMLWYSTLLDLLHFNLLQFDLNRTEKFTQFGFQQEAISNGTCGKIIFVIAFYINVMR